MTFICGVPSAELPPSSNSVVILRWLCPLCSDQDQMPGEECGLCLGRGAITQDTADTWLTMAEPGDPPLRPAPVPPAVMRSPCRDCAFRPGAPEEDEQPPVERPFYCHHGMPVVNGAYAPTAWADGKPLGAMVCRGWWAAATGEPLPAEAYRPANDGWGRP
ncbi:hypothetical protein [Sphaerimonospora thailandensis]|uniref:Uncharacterized protein n=1 Tax=Sphaerimonospora thailandensis TaxID=795644 RepID=A0A8J3VZX5_9ACTN|nr:hypothetical protein [Sphaerimonospora thailandensis]GIH70306.1 hypothetical protein Mth01_25590 [Sphaerimonospora thailandensis]